MAKKDKNKDHPFDESDHRLNDDSNGEGEGEQSRPSIDIYREGVRHLREGRDISLDQTSDHLYPNTPFILKPTATGNYGFHNVFVETSPIDLKGLKFPKREKVNGKYVGEDFTFWKNIDEEGIASQSEFTSILQQWQETDSSLFKLFEPLFSPTLSKTKPIFAIAQQLINREALIEIKRQKRFQDGISLCGTSGGFAFCPQREWFSPEIQQLTMADLIPVLPPAERQLFLLVLGRVMVGRDFSYTVEGIEINHTFRSMLILIGKKGGIGKSTFMRYITTALSFLGYEVATLERPGSRFGWGKVVKSHLGYCDDLTRKSQKNFITSDDTKTIVSNEALTTEQKGIDSVSQRAKTVLIACSNDFNKNDLYDLDHGMITRLNTLQCYNQDELECSRRELSPICQDSPDLRIREHWDYLANKLGVDITALASWILCNAKEIFLDACGYVKNEETNKYEQIKPNQLEVKMHTHRVNLQLTTSNDHTENLIVFARMLLESGLDKVDKTVVNPLFNYLESQDTSLIRCLILNSIHLIDAYYEGEKQSELGEEDFSCVLFIELLQKDFEDKNFPTIHPYRAVIDLRDNSSYLAAIERANTLKKLKEPEEKILSGFFEKLYTDQGLRYSGQPQWVKTYWASANRESFDSIKSSLLARIDHHGIDQARKVYEEEVTSNEAKANRNYKNSVLQCYPRELTFIGKILSRTLKEYHKG